MVVAVSQINYYLNELVTLKGLHKLIQHANCKLFDIFNAKFLRIVF